MREIKTQLIQLGKLREDLRPHIRPVLAVLSAAKQKQSSWVQWRRFIPVRNPLFHATTGVRAESILKDGLRSDQGLSRFGPEQQGISLARSPIPLMGGAFGNTVLVLDGDEVRRKFSIVPYSDNSIIRDEMEERVRTKHIPASMIKGVAYLGRVSRVEMRYIARKARDAWKVPVILKDSEKGWIHAEDVLQPRKRVSGKRLSW